MARPSTLDARAEKVDSLGSPDEVNRRFMEQLAYDGMLSDGEGTRRDIPTSGFGAWWNQYVPAVLGGKRLGPKRRHHLVGRSRSWDRNPLRNVVIQIIMSIQSNPGLDDLAKNIATQRIWNTYIDDVTARRGAVRHSLAAKQHAETMQVGIGHQLEGPFDFRCFTFDHNPIYSGFEDQAQEAIGNIMGMARNAFESARDTNELKFKGLAAGMDVGNRLFVAGMGPAGGMSNVNDLFGQNVSLEFERFGREVHNTLGFLDESSRKCKLWNPVLNTWMRWPNIQEMQNADAATYGRTPEDRYKYATYMVYSCRYLGAEIPGTYPVPAADPRTREMGPGFHRPARGVDTPESIFPYTDPITGVTSKVVACSQGDPGAVARVRRANRSDLDDMVERILRAHELMGGGPRGMEAAREQLATIITGWDDSWGQNVDPTLTDPDDIVAAREAAIAGNQLIVDRLNRVFKDKQDEMVVCLEAEAHKRQENVSLSGNLNTDLRNGNPWYEASTYRRFLVRGAFAIVGVQLAIAAIGAIGTGGSLAGYAGAVLGATATGMTSGMAGAAGAFMTGVASAVGASVAFPLVVGVAAATTGYLAFRALRNIWRGRQVNRLGQQIARNRRSARDIREFNDPDVDHPGTVPPHPRGGIDPPGPILPVRMGVRPWFGASRFERGPTPSETRRYDTMYPVAHAHHEFIDTAVGSEDATARTVSEYKSYADHVFAEADRLYEDSIDRSLGDEVALPTEGAKPVVGRPESIGGLPSTRDDLAERRRAREAAKAAFDKPAAPRTDRGKINKGKPIPPPQREAS